MTGLSKVQTSNHVKALAILEQETLSYEDKVFVFDHYQACATNLHKTAGAFFTPLSFAWEFCLNLEGSNRIIDLCAGIGVLSFTALQRDPQRELVCIEINPEYVKAGKKLVPEATWRCMDVMDTESLLQLGEFDAAISNPPFANVETFKDKKSPTYTGAKSEYKVIDIASQLALWGFFILPQNSTPFHYSGVQYYKLVNNFAYQKFHEQTGFEINIGVSIDTAIIHNEEGDIIEGAFPLAVEFAEVDFSNISTGSENDRQPDLFTIA
jgi:hypothetical protein